MWEKIIHAFSFLFLIPFLVTAADPVKVAVIGSDADCRKMADLLEVPLFAKKEIAVLEREKLDKAAQQQKSVEQARKP